MKPIRLAIVRQKYRPDGGAERFISRALEALDQQAMDLNVITRQWQGERQANWNLHLCNPVKWGRISRERGFAVAARALWEKENFDIVQSHERIAGCDIYRAGDGVHQRWLELRARLLPSWRQKLLMRDRYHRYVIEAERAMYQAPELKAVICNAHMVKQEIIDRFGVSHDKIHVIYNAIDSAQFIPVDESERLALRKKLSLPVNASILIFVGSGFERKGLAAAIRAVSGTNRYLVVVGKDKAEKQYRALAGELGCSERVIFAGMQTETLTWYQAADGLILPTLYDPFPNVILEAMSCGLPVITSTTCGGSEFIRAGENGYVCDALDIPALRDAIMALPLHASGSKMAFHARERVKDSSPQRLSQQLVSLYQQILD
ncbi:glycosyltransferase family 4 protein [Erwinia persicina]|uniref:glycosyltransferase family 4 protein n=1 Tax=Erwinia persicina TaxID=55211 RepID=UPI0017868FF1|nr:glycosyltransferase family 4 protein [Erwinia persicina]MBD8164843.1 glycosyltransferase family 4 protein [Erwinia persicina]